MTTTTFHPMRRTLLLIALLSCAAGTALAQAAGAADDKQPLVQRLLQLWHVEDTALKMVQRPALEAIQQARIALQGRVSAQKQEAAMKEIAADVQKYIDETTPLVRDSSQRLKPEVIGPLLAQNFSADELRQLIALLESPVKKKFEQLVPQMERAFGEQVAAQNRAAVDPKLKAMQEAVGLKLRAATITP
jgi:hypothetical protein